MMKQTYTQQETEQILQEAVRRVAQDEAARATGSAEVSRERLLAMAEELGVSPEALDAVLRDREAERAKSQERAAEQAERAEFITHRRAEFLPHLWSYLGVNTMLFGINLMSGADHWWFVYPLLGWGVGIASHAASALPTRGSVFEKEFAAWREKRRKKAEKERRKAEEEAEKRRRAEAAYGGARHFGPGAPGEQVAESVADAVQQVAGVVQQAVGEAARAVDSALRSADWTEEAPARRDERLRYRRRRRDDDRD